ncbi:MAG: ParA family protein, partial [Leptolyngbya sp. SIO4C5]|nr:ParA family protein [Leptolyngbya sp. SIO4C5]
MLFNPEYCRTEGDVESKLIVQYLLPELGYSQQDWYQEIALGSIRLDFLAFATQVIPFSLNDGSPLSLVIEAKR